MKGLSRLPRRLAMVDTRNAQSLRDVSRSEKECKPIYGTAAFKRWRDEVIRRAGRRCEECGERTAKMYADHVIELEDGGEPFDVTNGRSLCAKCHGTKTATERARRVERDEVAQ